MRFVNGVISGFTFAVNVGVGVFDVMKGRSSAAALTFGLAAFLLFLQLVVLAEREKGGQ